MPDWQLIIVLVVVAGAAAFLAMRIARFMQGPRRPPAGCGGSCGGCTQPGPSNVVPLDTSGARQRGD